MEKENELGENQVITSKQKRRRIIILGVIGFLFLGAAAGALIATAFGRNKNNNADSSQTTGNGDDDSNISGDSEHSSTPIEMGLMEAPPPGSMSEIREIAAGSDHGQRISIRLPIAPQGQLYTLVRFTFRADSTGEKFILPVGRSYDGFAWEGVKPLDLKFDVNDFGDCTVDLDVPDDESVYQLRTFERSFSSDSSILTEMNIQIARFLERTTFGPNMDMIESWEYGDAADWVGDQMAIPATEHREYYRERATARRYTAYPAASPYHPCDKGSRWRRFALTFEDRDFDLEVLGSSPPYVLSLHGVPITEINDLGNLQVGTTYNICRAVNLGEKAGGVVWVKPINGACVKLTIGNPQIQFDQSLPDRVIELPFSSNDFDIFPTVNEAMSGGDERILSEPLSDNICNTIPASTATGQLISARTQDGVWYNYDPHLAFQDNQVEDPLADGWGKTNSPGSLCSNVPRTFLNENGCRLSAGGSAACSPTKVDYTVYKLDDPTLLKMMELTNRFVYSMNLHMDNGDGSLALEYSPCVKGSRSRWVIVDDIVCETDITDSQTITTLSNLLDESASGNEYLRDIWLPNEAACNDGGGSIIGTKLSVDGTCFQHAHPDHLNVYDMTKWARRDTHPGNKIARDQGKPNPIKNFARQGLSVLVYPSHHEPSRWENSKETFALIGRYGDEVASTDLPASLRSEELAKELGALSESNYEQGVVVCGSPGEIANDPFLGDIFEINESKKDKFPYQPETVFTMVALDSDDQLRQRMAWALAQILVISPSAFANVHLDDSEIWVNYYDIFVRHAFGNYRDILKEVSYSPMMATMLSYTESKSSQYVKDTLKEANVFPDENYAREILQLFSVGLLKLNMDGTAMGPNKQVYTNEDIMDGARAWTGFLQQPRRGNKEDLYANWMDPMNVEARWRDPFPKMNLNGGYIGDGYPRCTDLPEQHFLKDGAKYRLLGSSALPELQYDDTSWNLFDPTIRRVVLEPASGDSLYEALCSKDATTGNCNFKGLVTLGENLPCVGIECVIDTVRVVQVANMFYEYVRVPCVEMVFYNDAQKVKEFQEGDGSAMCANPFLPAASEACCLPGSPTKAQRSCEYVGERMTYAASKIRCNANGMDRCDFKRFDLGQCDGCCKHKGISWSTASCTLGLKVNNEGKVAVVHQPQNVSTDGINSAFSIDAENWFRVAWDADFPSVRNNCGDNNACEIRGDFCLCRLSVVDEALFGNDAQISSLEVSSKLHIGSVHPRTYGEDVYTMIEADGVRIWSHHSTPISNLDDKTLFEIEDEYGEAKFYRNVVSKVMIGTVHAFRNSPHFVSFVEPEVRDCQYETDAVIDNSFYNQNTAPFLAKLLIQRFGTSNPSSGYVERVATAFYTGQYNANDKSFGSGDYGDLAATVAAVVLDREVTSLILDADASTGSLKEPLLKVLHFMRAMEFQNNENNKITFLRDMEAKIGQMSHEFPGVFSFFRPDYAPPGPLASSQLVAPETFDITTPKLLGLLGGCFSMVKYGLNACEQGFGLKSNNCNRVEEANYGKSDGRLGYTPSSMTADVLVEEMCLLLTSGRCTPENRQIIRDTALSNGYNTNVQRQQALRIAQQLVVASPEFHCTNLVETSHVARPEPNAATPSSKPYKAVVYFFMEGGCDTFNLLVPKGCDMTKRYSEARGRVALYEDDLLPINAGTSQDCMCSQFGVHPSLPVLQNLYSRNDAVFLSNTGVLFEPVTKSNYQEKMKTRLFAHDKQQDETKFVDPHQDVAGTGVLGRMVDALTRDGYKTSATSVIGVAEALVGEPLVSPPVMHLSYKGVTQFDPRPSSDKILPAIKALNNGTTLSSSMFGETYSSMLYDALYQNSVMSEALSSTSATAEFPGTPTGQQFEFVSRLIKAHSQRGTDRDAFYVKLGGFDMHDNVQDDLAAKFKEMNDAITSFVTEMELHQGKWDDVTIVFASEFGRTLSPNSGNGTDHAWAGNYFILGGGLEGGKIHGQYPTDLSSEGPFSTGRGRIIPTMPWESPMNAVAQWMGVTGEAALDKVLPNRKAFKGSLLSKDILFKNGD